MSRSVVILAFPGVQTLDVAGPLEVFHTAARIARGAPTTCGRRARRPGRAHVERPRPAARRRAAERARRDRHAARRRRQRRARRARATPTLVRWVAAAAARSRRVDLGLHRRVPARAQAGLLDGRRATTHWACVRRARRALSRTSTVERRSDLRARRRRLHLGRASPPAWTWRWRSSRRTSAARSRSRSRAGSCCSSSAPAASRSSARSSPRRLAEREPLRDAAGAGSPSTWTPTCRCRRWPRAPT